MTSAYYNDYDNHVGVGGIDLVAMNNVQQYGIFNGNFATHAANDAWPNNNAFDRVFNVTDISKKVHLAVAWLNRGSYIYSHTNASIPNGLNCYVTIYKPNGDAYMNSYGYYNGWIKSEFWPSTTGNYRMSISCPTQQDASLSLKMAYAIAY